MLNLPKCLIWAIAVFLVLVAGSDVVKRGNVTTEPESIVAREGETVDFLCKVNKKISTCRFNLSGYPDEIKLNEMWDFKRNDSITYFGAGLDKGECGMKVPNVTEKNNGFAICYLDPNDGELDDIGTFKVTIIRAQQPQIEIASSHSAEKYVSESEVETTSNAEAFEASKNASTAENLANETIPSITEELAAVEPSATLPSVTTETLANQTQRSYDQENVTESGSKLLITESSKNERSFEQENVTESGSELLITESSKDDNPTDDASGLSVVSIVALCVMLILFLVSVSLVTTAKLTKRWCFKGDSMDFNVFDSEGQVTPQNDKTQE